MNNITIAEIKAMREQLGANILVVLAIDEENGQQIDGKNMMHCQRLLDMAVEIASGQGLLVRRPNREELLDIRRGKVNLEELLAAAQGKIDRIKDLFNDSKLPSTSRR